MRRCFFPFLRTNIRPTRYESSERAFSHTGQIRLPGMPMLRMGTAMVEDGKRIWQWFEDYDYDDGDFTLLGTDFEAAHPVLTGQVGLAHCRLFDLKAGVDFACAWLPAHRKDGRPMPSPDPDAGAT